VVVGFGQVATQGCNGANDAGIASKPAVDSADVGKVHGYFTLAAAHMIIKQLFVG
jgi:hypothetical protein